MERTEIAASSNKKMKSLYACSKSYWYKILDMESLAMDDEEPGEGGGKHRHLVDGSLKAAEKMMWPVDGSLEAAEKMMWPEIPRAAAEHWGSTALALLDSSAIIHFGYLGEEVVYLDLNSPEQGWKNAPSLTISNFIHNSFALDGGKICAVHCKDSAFVAQLLDVAKWEWDVEVRAENCPFFISRVIPDTSNRRVVCTVRPKRHEGQGASNILLMAYHLDDRQWKCLNPQFNKELHCHSVIVDDVLYSIHSASTLLLVYDMISNEFLPRLDLVDVYTFIPPSILWWFDLLEIGCGWLCLVIWDFHEREPATLIHPVLFRIKKDFDGENKKLRITHMVRCFRKIDARCFLQKFLAF